MQSTIKCDSELIVAPFSKNPSIVFKVVTDELKKSAFECECLAFGSTYIYNRILDVDVGGHWRIYKSILDIPEVEFISTCAIDSQTNKVISGMRNERYPANGVHVTPLCRTDHLTSTTPS